MVRRLSLLSLVLFWVLPLAAQSPQVPFNAPGRYEIESVSSGLVLDVKTPDNRQVQQYTRTNHENQQWDIQPAGGGYFYIRSVGTGKVLSLANGSSRNGTRVIVSPRNGREDQLWEIVSVGPAQFRIVSKYGRMLDVPNGSDERGTPLQIWNANKRNQLFRLVLVRLASPSAYRGMNSSAPWGSQPPERGSRDWRRAQAARACRAEVSRHIADLPASQISVDPVSRDAQGNLLVMWRTPRASSGFCRVTPSGQIMEFKVEEMSR